MYEMCIDWKTVSCQFKSQSDIAYIMQSVFHPVKVQFNWYEFSSQIEQGLT